MASFGQLPSRLFPSPASIRSPLHAHAITLSKRYICEYGFVSSNTPAATYQATTRHPRDISTIYMRIWLCFVNPPSLERPAGALLAAGHENPKGSIQGSRPCGDGSIQGSRPSGDHANTLFGRYICEYGFVWLNEASSAAHPCLWPRSKATPAQPDSNAKRCAARSGRAGHMRIIYHNGFVR